MIERIQENTMGTLGSVPTGMSGMGAASYVVSDGSTIRGMSCVLSPRGHDNVVVGLGSMVEVSGGQWEVIGTEKTNGEPGFVTLQLRSRAADIADVAPSSELDFHYSTACPQCGARGGWTGEIEKELDEPVLRMHCLSCGNEFVWYSGVLAPMLKSNPPEFMPGRLSLEERQVILEEEVSKYLRKGFRVVSNTESTAKLTLRKKFSFTWAAGGFLFLGIGLLVYLIWWRFSEDRIVYLRVAPEGGISPTATRFDFSE